MHALGLLLIIAFIIFIVPIIGCLLYTSDAADEL